MDSQTVIAAYAAGLILLFVFIKVFYTPIKVALRLIVSSLFGGAALFVLNFAGAAVGIKIGINIITAAVAGIFGIPGISLMLLLQIAISS